MPNWCFNRLTIRGPVDEIKRFKDGVQIVDGSYRILQSYVPCPRKLLDFIFIGFSCIGYDACFDPNPEAYLRVLKYPDIEKHGIQTRTQLIEHVKREYPDSYKNGIQINNNLFEFGVKCSNEWRDANWGTKWDEYCNQLNEVSPTELVFEFDTAWSPPILGYCQISAHFRELDFHLEFDERGMDFGGYCRWINGKLIEISS